VIGHEVSGTVAAVGPEVEGLDPGDRVVVMPLDWCGECRPCRRGTHNICYDLRLLGIDTPGSMQERWIAPARVVFPVPAGVPLDLAALVEPLAVAVHDVSRGGVAAGDRVVVIGGGPVGQLIALVARERGAEVVVSEPDGFRRGFADESGFTTIDPTATDPAAWVAEWTGGEGADVAFEVSATTAGARAMTDVLAGRGTAVAVGIYAQPPPVDLFRFFWRELSLIGARVYADEDFAAAVDLVAGGALPLDRFVSAVYPLEQAAEAFARLEAGGGLMKVLIDSRPDRDAPGTR
jgi:2-desacetyl-2-hydroxyethyl bacteriochlorophyllide A dehydrogenase